MTKSTMLCSAGLALALLIGLPRVSNADLTPEWDVLLPVGNELSAGLRGVVTDAAGVTYVTGIAGPDANLDVQTAAYAPDGTLLWSRLFDGPQAGHESVGGTALGADGLLYVTGSTPDENSVATLLVLKYDPVDGALLDSILYSGSGFSEGGASIAVDEQGAMFVAGSTVGDGPDVQVLRFDPAGALAWRRIWDGPPFSPFSADSAKQILLDPNGDPVVMIHGIMNSLHPDFVVVKYDRATGAEVWEATWGVTGGDFPREMLIDMSGDIYVTGTGIDFVDKYSTIKLTGADGSLIWQRYDQGGIDDSSSGIALDGAGGLYITGTVDPDGNASNANNQIYTVKRDAMTGDFLWDFVYGDTCVGCSDGSSDVAVDADGTVYVAGATSSAPYSHDAILFVLDPATGVEVDRAVVESDPNFHRDFGVALFDARDGIRATGENDNVNTGDTDITVTAYPSRLVDVYDFTVSELVAGSVATVEVEHATPGATQYLAFGLTGLGTMEVPQLEVEIELEAPRLAGTAIADAGGNAIITLSIPENGAGRGLWLQIAEAGRTAAPTMGRVRGSSALQTIP